MARGRRGKPNGRPNGRDRGDDSGDGDNVVSLPFERLRRGFAEAGKPLRFWVIDPETRETRETADPEEWARCQARWHNLVADELRPMDARPHGRWLYLSTIFTGLDMDTVGGIQRAILGPGFPHQPVLFETMLFDCHRSPIETHRYATWKEAATGHEEVVARVTGDAADRRRRVIVDAQPVAEAAEPGDGP